MVADLWGSADVPVAPAPEFAPGSLEAKFVAPPFSVLDTRQGYWQDRRRAWLSLGLQSELGRGADLLSLSPAEQARARWAGEGAVAQQGGQGRGLAAPMRHRIATRQAMERQRQPGYRFDEREGEEVPAEVEVPTGGTSIFDPVLCELMYRWFAPEGGHVLDPFAGGSVRGIVAAKLGHPYTGVDLSGAQLAANREQAARILLAGEPVPRWHEGDSRVVLREAMPALSDPVDMVLTCPPYFDLEVYSDHPADLSAMAWPEFVAGYGEVMALSAEWLRDERFAVWVVSEVRDAQGYCRGLVPLTIRVAEEAGLRLYNEAVLINSAGSLPLRVTKYMEASRKLGRAHQNVLVFVKGKPPRGWSWDRAAPPSPQLGLFEEPVPINSAAPAPIDIEPPQQAPAEDATEAPNVAPVGAPEEDEAPGASWASGPVGEWRALEDGGYVDTGTGEVVAERPSRSRPINATPTMTAEEWERRRGREWNPGDPNRPCWSCGLPPDGTYHDGSPRYDHTHNVQALTMFGDE